MLRTGIIHLLIGVLLACPYLCASESPSCVTPCQTGGCSCHNHNDRSDEQSPQSPDGSHPDCLCHGATIEWVRPADLGEPAPPAIIWLIDDFIPMTISLPVSAASSERLHPFPPFATGRDICTLRGLWLI